MANILIQNNIESIIQKIIHLKVRTLNNYRTDFDFVFFT